MVKILKCDADPSKDNSFMSPGGEWAVIYEGHGDVNRLSVWDLKQGKLVRFLSAEKDKGTREYAGVDDADFGAKIEQKGTQAFTFSTDGKLAAASFDKTVKIWELASGKLLHEVEGGRYHHLLFRFIDERRIVGKSSGIRAIEVIDARTGEKRQLMAPDKYESYGGAVREDTVALVNVREVFTLSLQTGERKRLADVSPSSKMAAERTWYSPDGKKLYLQRREIVQLLDVASGKYLDTYPVVGDKYGYRVEGLATDANLLVVVHAQQVELWDAALGTVRTLIFPTSKSSFGGISADGSKLIVVQQYAAFVLDFGGMPPAGRIEIAKLLIDQKPVPTR